MDTVEKYVLSINHYRNLTKAAHSLGISQPALTQAVNSAEKKLGFSIFNRRCIPIAPTPEGEVYLRYLLRNEAAIRDYTKEIADIRATSDNHFIIGAPSVYAHSIIADAIIAFGQQNPGLNISIREAPLSDLISMSESAELDCFISTDDQLPEGFEKTEVFVEELFMCIPAAWEIHIKSVADSNISAIHGLDFVALEEDQPLRKITDKVFLLYGIQMHNRVTVNQVALALKLSSYGLGITVASAGAIANCKTADRLKCFPLPEPYYNRSIYLAFDANRYRSNACRKFITYMRHSFSLKRSVNS